MAKNETKLSKLAALRGTIVPIPERCRLLCCEHIGMFSRAYQVWLAVRVSEAKTIVGALNSQALGDLVCGYLAWGKRDFAEAVFDPAALSGWIRERDILSMYGEVYAMHRDNYSRYIDLKALADWVDGGAMTLKCGSIRGPQGDSQILLSINELDDLHALAPRLDRQAGPPSRQVLTETLAEIITARFCAFAKATGIKLMRDE